MTFPAEQIYGCIHDYNAGIVIEIKHAASIDVLSRACERAPTQIREKRYDAALREDGRTDISAYGIAFYKKTCEVKVVKL